MPEHGCDNLNVCLTQDLEFSKSSGDVFDYTQSGVVRGLNTLCHNFTVLSLFHRHLMNEDTALLPEYT